MTARIRTITWCAVLWRRGYAGQAATPGLTGLGVLGQALSKLAWQGGILEVRRGVHSWKRGWTCGNCDLHNTSRACECAYVLGPRTRTNFIAGTRTQACKCLDQTCQLPAVATPTNGLVL